MKKVLMKLTLIACICLLLIQLYQPSQNTDNRQPQSMDFTKTYTVPKNIETIFQNSCYDCHSNNTKYLWFDQIQPLGILVEHHIRKGKENLNFSEWGNYSSRKQQIKLDRITKQIKANEMPLKSYIILHKNARLTAHDKQEIINWVNTLKNKSDE